MLILVPLPLAELHAAGGAREVQRRVAARIAGIHVDLTGARPRAGEVRHGRGRDTLRCGVEDRATILQSHVKAWRAAGHARTGASGGSSFRQPRRTVSGKMRELCWRPPSPSRLIQRCVEHVVTIITAGAEVIVLDIERLRKLSAAHVVQDGAPTLQDCARAAA